MRLLIPEASRIISVHLVLIFSMARPIVSGSFAFSSANTFDCSSKASVTILAVNSPSFDIALSSPILTPRDSDKACIILAPFSETALNSSPRSTPELMACDHWRITDDDSWVDAPDILRPCDKAAVVCKVVSVVPPID